MRKISIFFLLLLLSSCGGKPVLTDELYTTIAADVICSDTNSDATVFAKYGFTEQQMNDFRAAFVKEPARAEKIRKEFAQKTADCLAKQ